MGEQHRYGVLVCRIDTKLEPTGQGRWYFNRVLQVVVFVPIRRQTESTEHTMTAMSPHHALKKICALYGIKTPWLGQGV